MSFEELVEKTENLYYDIRRKIDEESEEFRSLDSSAGIIHTGSGVFSKALSYFCPSSYYERPLKRTYPTSGDIRVLKFWADNTYRKGFLTREKEIWERFIVPLYLENGIEKAAASCGGKASIKNHWYMSEIDIVAKRLVEAPENIDPQKLPNDFFDEEKAKDPLFELLQMKIWSPDWFWLMSYVPGFGNEVRGYLRKDVICLN